MPKPLPSEEIQALLKSVYDECVQEDDSVRQRQIRQWRQLKLLWEGYSQIWYSEVAHDWRIWDAVANSDNDQAAYDKPINVFKAYLESIIAALSVTVPPIKCFPDDADDTLDLATARAGDKISQLVYRHNDAPILWLHSLYIYVTEGCTAYYNYAESSEAYGTYENKEYEDVETEEEIAQCPLCGFQLGNNPNAEVPPEVMAMGEQVGQQLMQPDMGMQPDPMNPDMQSQMPPEMGMQPQMPSQMGAQQQPEMNPEQLHGQELSEFDPDNQDAPLQYALQEGQDLCPSCMKMMDPQISTEKFITTRLKGITQEPKTRICLEVYGGLNVKVPNYAKKQKDIPYLIFSVEKNYVEVVSEFKHLHGNSKLKEALKGPTTSGAYNQYDQWGRLSPQYQGEYPINVITVNKAWLRPCAFNFLCEADAKKLTKLYPNGAKVTFANDIIAEACNESLDDHWTLTENPLSDYIHFSPLGQTLVSIQEITNDLVSLILQTIEHGIGQTFADPGVFNFNAYEQTEVNPGGIFPATPKSGKSLKDAFMELRTANLSAEVMPFYSQVQQMGQVTSGALPSLFGGQVEGSGTASEYSMSRAQALQRLQNTWKLFTTTWKTLFMKVVPMYVKEVQHDEREVSRNDDGNFINTFIRKSEMEGRIGRVELEANENLPLTWGQKKDLMLQLMTNPNQMIQQLLMAPENAAILHEAIGLVDFYVPGEDDIIKQYDEIKILLNSEPYPTGDPMTPLVSSVEIDPIMDNHAVEFEIVRKWAVSEAGRQTKIENEPGYQNVLLHGKLHYDQMQMQMMEQSAMSGQGDGTPPKKPDSTKSKEAPITGESDVKTL